MFEPVDEEGDMREERQQSRAYVREKERERDDREREKGRVCVIETIKLREYEHVYKRERGGEIVRDRDHKREKV